MLPSGYTQLDLSDPKQLAIAILITLSKQELYGLALSLCFYCPRE